MTPRKQRNDPPRMLVLEDEPTSVAALRRYFSTAGFEVACAHELEEAEALMAVDSYDVVIADLVLSRSYAAEGLEILRFVRQHSPGTRVVVVSAHGSPDIQHSARSLGAEAFFQKPAPLPDIAAAVNRILAGGPR